MLFYAFIQYEIVKNVISHYIGTMTITALKNAPPCIFTMSRTSAYI